MSAATQNRFAERAESDIIAYSGGSGYHYYRDTLIMKQGLSLSTITPVASAGCSGGLFLGVAVNEVNLAAGLGASQEVLNIWKTGVFTFASNGVGATSDIGRRAWALDDSTVGLSMASQGGLYVGEITGVPSSTTYRVRIDPAVNFWGASVQQN